MSLNTLQGVKFINNVYYIIWIIIIFFPVLTIKLFVKETHYPFS